MNTVEHVKLGTRKPFGGKITTLLAGFGVSIKRGSKRNFELHNHDSLAWMYHDARENYHKQMKQAHPDAGGNEEDALRINAAWDRVEFWFRRHYPQALIVAALAFSLTGCNLLHW